MTTASVVDQLEDYKALLARYFRAHNLLPILVPANQRVGDVYDPAQHWLLVSTGEECFPTLKEPAEVSSSLVYTVSLDQRHLSSALGLSSLFSLGFSRAQTKQIQLSFTDVRIRRASQMALRNALCPACKHLGDIVEGRTAAFDGSMALLVVVGTVVAAKRQVFVGMDDRTEVEASAEQLGSLGTTLPLKILGLDPTLSAGLGYGGQRGLLLQSDEVLPVAFAPAFIPQVIFDQPMGGADVPAEPVAVEWHPADAVASPDGDRLLHGWLEAISPSLPVPGD